LLTAFDSPLPQPTEWQGIGNQINAAMIFARADFVNVDVCQETVRKMALGPFSIVRDAGFEPATSCV
jgi:hypothetical protein